MPAARSSSDWSSACGESLGLEAAEVVPWCDALMPLLGPASRGIWPVEARLLYDLQKVCSDHERTIYAVDVVEAVFSLGRRPIKRPLFGQGEVFKVKHLRSAARLLAAAHINEPERRCLARLIEQGFRQAEKQVRDKFRPVVTEVLGNSGLRATNLVETVALNKIIEELLDRVVERGYLNMGDLRDAISRNRLKLPDLRGVRDFVRGDRLIRANRRLPVQLDGVYRRGELYLRGLQACSALAFGTAIGRLLVLYVLLPFGGAFLAAEGMHHLVHQVQDWISWNEPAEADRKENLLATLPETLLLGCILFGLMHCALLRRLAWQTLVMSGRALRMTLVAFPTYVLRLPPVRWLLESRFIRLLVHYLLRPALAAMLSGLLGRAAGLQPFPSFLLGAAAFLVGCVLLNTRLARDLEEAITEWLVRIWHRLNVSLLPALFQFIMNVFKNLFEGIDRLLYTVDEWLRFRSGDSQWSLAAKLVLGLFWFFVAYVIRIVINLFVEPQTNPIKHFPVVTVTAKLMLPFYRELLHVCAPLEPMVGRIMAHLVADTVFFLLPGLGGFLVWELLHNWRLYRANQPETLQPEIIGHHGEDLPALLRLGFRSGTLPKLYRRLRRAARRSSRSRNRAAVRRQRTALHHAEEGVRHFAERGLLGFLNSGRIRGTGQVTTGQIRLGCQRILIELRCAGTEEASAWISFEEQSGSLLAGLPQPGWIARLTGGPKRSFFAALTGWYKMAGVDLIRGPLADAGAIPDKVQPGLAVLPSAGSPREFGSAQIPFSRWIEIWEHLQEGKELPESFLPAVMLLLAGSAGDIRAWEESGFQP